MVRVTLLMNVSVVDIIQISNITPHSLTDRYITMMTKRMYELDI